MDLLPEREAKARETYALAAAQKELKDNPEFARMAERLIDGYYCAVAKEGGIPNVRVRGLITEEFVEYFKQRLHNQGYTTSLSVPTDHRPPMMMICKFDKTHLHEPLKYGTFRRDPHFASPWMIIDLAPK